MTNQIHSCRLRFIISFVLLLLPFMYEGNLFGQTTRYVAPTSSGTADGSSWTNASADLQAIINTSVSGDQVWVAAGTYKPNRKATALTVIVANDRDNAFVLKENVKVYGHFAGNETLLSQRNLANAANTTILSGDFSNNDTYNANGVPTGGNTENAYHVVVVSGSAAVPVTANTILDGFTIKGGNANGAGTITVNTRTIGRNYGGAVHNNNSAAIFTNIKAISNAASVWGGAIYNYYAPSTFDYLTVNGNSAQLGGGMYNSNSQTVVTNSTFNYNTATQNGGGISNVSSPINLSNTVINANSAAAGGGGLYNSSSAAICKNLTFTNNSISGTYGKGGGIFNTGSDAVFTNVKVTGNTATTTGSEAGGIYNSNSNAIFTSVLIAGNNPQGVSSNTGAPIFTNVTITANTSGGVRNYSTKPKFRNCIIYGNTGTNVSNNTSSDNKPEFSYSIVQGSSSGWGSIGTNSGNNSDVNPLFTNATGNDFTLSGSSTAINSGNSNLFLAGQVPDISYATTDLDGNFRVQGSSIDRGAYEYSGCTPASPTAAAAQTLCTGAKVSNLAATGTTLKWYSTPIGGTVLTAATVLTTGNYYVSQTISGCESLRVPVSVTILTTPPPVAVNQQVTPGTTVSGLTATGTNLKWYSSATATTPFTSSAPAVSAWYYVTQTLNGCESTRTILVVTVAVTIVPDAGGIVYVKKGSTGNGSSWTNAAGELADAMRSARLYNDATPGTVTEIWVAKGTYHPKYTYDNMYGTSATNRDNTFLIVNNVKMYGGFAGNETSLSQRNLSITSNASILSGDFNNNDVISGSGNSLTITNNSENAYHVMIGAGKNNLNLLTAATLVDGFTLKGGNANGQSGPNVYGTVAPGERYNGGGIFNYHSAARLSNLKLIGNSAGDNGGGVYTGYLASITLEKSSVELNMCGTSSGSGGGMYSIASSPIITDVSFNGNNSDDAGGGIYFGTNSSSVLTNVSVSSNYCRHSGGGIHHKATSLTLNNVIISGNTAMEGGGLYIYSAALVTNGLEVSGNYVTYNGGGIYLYNYSPTISFATITGNTANATGGGIYLNASSSHIYNVRISENNANGDGGGIYAMSATPVITNALISGNTTAGRGGGICNYNSVSVITNVTIAGNTADAGGGSYTTSSSAPKMRNCIIYGNTGYTLGTNVYNSHNFANCLVQGSGGSSSWVSSYGTNAGGNIDTDPTLTMDGDFNIQAGSPAVNKGNSSFITSGTPNISYATTDLLGATRIQGTAVDMGAYELNVCGTAAPVASAQSFCNSATVANLTAAGTSLQWYAAATGGAPLASSTALSTTTYYVSQTLSGCVSERMPVNVTITVSPAPVAVNQSFCDSATVANLNISGTAPKWYSAATGGTALASTTALSAGTYYVSQTLSGCESPRTAVTVAIHNTAAPTTTPLTLCNGSTVANLTATGTALKWYGAATGGTSLPSNSLLYTETYYVSQTLNGCESTRTPASVSIQTTPPPTASSQTFCSGSTVSNLTASGTSLRWFAASTGGAQLAAAAVLATGTYYVSQTLSGCQSTRTAVTVTVNTTPVPTVIAQAFCNSATVSDLSATGTTLQWYATASGGSPLISTAVLSTGTYYVSQTLNSCESNRAAFNVTIHTTPAPTAVPLTFCNGSTVADLTATGTALKWYAAATGGSSLASATLLATDTYYVSQTLNSCESARTAVSVTINTTPAPTATAQTFCNGSTVSDLTASGEALQWYAAATGGSSLASTTLLATGTYYVSQTLSSCESERTAVNVTVNTTPAPTAAAQTFCNGSTVFNMTASGTALQWYAASTGGSSLASTSVLTTGTYYVSQTLNSCESTRTSVNVVINPTVYGTDTQAACGSYTWINGQVYNVSNNTATYTLTSVSTGCDSIVTLNLTINQTVYGTDTQAACGSYTWINGQVYNASNNTATHTLTSLATGCDSIVTLNLTINQTVYGTDTQTACGSYAWIDGQVYTASNNTATHTLTSVATGCDSIVTLNLTITQPVYGTDTQTACSSYTWIDGQVYTASNNTATHTLTSIVTGCDSIVTLNLTITQPVYGTDSQTACSSYTWINGQVYTASNNTATHTLTSIATGCDSIVTLNLTITQPVYGTDTQNACSSYTWIDGQVYTASNNTATHTLTSIATGCDSIVTLNLTITQPVYGTDTQNACSSYTWIDGQVYTASNNTATHTLTSIATGCDSIVTLNLTISGPVYSTVNVQQANTYYWAQTGLTYIYSGLYADTVLTTAGCDSIITLNLTITQLTVNTFISPSNLNECTGKVSVTATENPDFIFDIGTGTPITSSTGEAQFENLCPGIYSLLTTDGNGDTLSSIFVIPGESNFILVDPFDTSNVILDSLAIAVENCDIDFATIDTAYIDSYTMTGIDTLEVIWKVVDQLQTTLIPVTYILNAGEGEYYLQLQLYCTQKSTGDVFVVTEGVHYSGGAISTAALHETGDNMHLLVYPSPAVDEVNVVFDTQKAELIVRDLHGKQLLKQTIKSGAKIDISAFPYGVYIFELSTERGFFAERIVKQ